MDIEHPISLSVRDQLMSTLDEIADMLRAVRELAAVRGCEDDWLALVKRLTPMRILLQFGPYSDNFEDDMDELCLAYDGFVSRVLPNPDEH